MKEEDILLIFIGYAGDAKEYVDSLQQLRDDIQKYLNELIKVSDNCIYRRIQFYDWNEDAEGVGGQKDLVDPYLKRANIALFIFKSRVGNGTWYELNNCRNKPDYPKNVFVFFPESLPENINLNQTDIAENWLNLLKKRDSLSENWFAADSDSIPVNNEYNNPNHLKEIVLRRIKDSMPKIISGSDCRSQNIRYPDLNIITKMEGENIPYIDRTTPCYDFDKSLVQLFRSKLRDELINDAGDKSDKELLQKYGFLKHGKLTNAGVLFFNKPFMQNHSWVIQCTVYKGTTKAADKTAYKRFDGSILLQLEKSQNFIKEYIEKRESKGSISTGFTAETVYKFPEKCVREIIANALCHRNYEDTQRQIYIRIFKDRIDILNPGEWNNPKKDIITKPAELDKLESESIPRNMSVAHALADIKIVEKEGSGIPTAVSDCKTTKSPVPSVYMEDGYVKTTIFPRKDWDSNFERSKKIFISYSHKDEQWKDRLETHLGVLKRQGLLEIWDDRQIKAGGDWFAEIERAVESTHAAILLISADFLNSGFILDQEIPRLFEQQEKRGMKIFPLIVRPCAWQEVEWLAEMQARPKDGEPLIKRSEYETERTLSLFAQEIFAMFNYPKVSQPRLPTVNSKIFGREKEMRILDDCWCDEHTNTAAFIGYGGVGKTALINSWLNKMGTENYPGARFVYDWSFYSQGTNENKQASAGGFFDHAFDFFEYHGNVPNSEYEKGEILARIIGKTKTILIIDGLEPLQHGPGPMHGILKVHGMRALLKGLSRFNKGLCIVSSRIEIQDLKNFKGDMFKSYELDNLSADAGMQVLRTYDIKGPDNELRKAAEELKCHALSLNLLGAYLKAVYDGDIRKRDKICRLTDEAKYGEHAKRVMDSYEIWFAENDKPELDFLYIMGLFDRPAAKQAIDVLTAKPAIQGLSERLTDLSYEKKQLALSHLQELRLILKSDDNTLDCHPLIREYFSIRLKTGNAKAFKQAHARLYEYYKELPEKHLPDTLQEMEPLFAAVMHGGLAGMHQEALDDVYYSRIQRDSQTNYCCNKLGAFGSDLACLSSFFESAWDKPVSGLTEQDKALVLNWAGFRLRAVGRLSEAVQPLRTSLKMYIKDKNWQLTTMAANNLGELLLTLGNINDALNYAQQSVEFADKSGDYNWKFTSRTTLADAYHHQGNIAKASELFIEAEKMQQIRQPEYKYLYSLQGFRYCDLLIDIGEYDQALQRSKTTLQWVKDMNWLLDIALDNLTTGKALFLKSLKQKTDDFLQAKDYLDKAVQGLRKAGYQDYLPRGLFVRAAFYRHENEYLKSWQDLDEAYEIAFYGSMKLHLDEYSLQARENIKKQLADHDVPGNYKIIENARELSLTRQEMEEKLKTRTGLQTSATGNQRGI